MEKMGLNEIRSKFLKFFESKGHYVRPSYPLVPEKDKSLLLINAGMAPLKPYFMGVETPPAKRMATCQKCIRTGDIENVGKTARHATFFEMLGNFSFGDYFKKESISWGWEFCTKHLMLPVSKLWVSIYEEDDEAFEIWNKEIGVPKERIVRLGKEDNFWEIGTGPCGPCSEIYVDRGEEYGCGSEDCKPGCECDRYVEIWNHVFTQFEKDEEGNYHKLPNPNIDTGMGLERVACIMQGVDTIFEIDTIKYILDAVLEISKKKYGKKKKDDISIRIITDHIKAVTFMVGDGIIPSNEGRGYVLRRLLRRAARHGKILGIEESFLADLTDKVMDVYGEPYPELLERKEYIKKIISVEEEKFHKTIDQGIEKLKDYIHQMMISNETVLLGEEAFRLYDTYGFPLDLTREILEEENLAVDVQGFNREMEKQRERARAARKDMEELGWETGHEIEIGEKAKSDFIGYDNFSIYTTVLGLIKDGEMVDEAHEGDEVSIILESTPLYPEGGGQVGDTGIIYNEDAKIEVLNSSKLKSGAVEHIVHKGKIIRGSFKKDEEVKVIVDMERRMNTTRNHTATHLLHKALKEILGNHIEQAGSLVTPERLRFDFTHFEAVTDEELIKVEQRVNEQIFEALDVDIRNTTLEEAKEIGATALFGEKYGETVRVVSIGDYSIELCGGTHVLNSSEIGIFKILSESGVAAGVRRIEAITGKEVYKYISRLDNRIKGICQLLKANINDIEGKIENLNNDVKKLQKENESLKNKLASGSMDEILKSSKEINGVNVVASRVPNLDMNSLRNLGDKLKDKLESCLIVLASEKDGKVNLIAMASEDAVKKGIHAGKIIKEVAKITGGGGGGRPNMAQAGGRDASKIDAAIEKVEELAKDLTV
ncbi:alanine--tRNA ligase [Paramaledivibacter caminithermalis]|jgi:alanyl-tRNA synthetase|uniref:Alanine--tRNA ligase n=1 Tax=Paramaledivibacter caminithermalis (strain DSM 15212 / CIP 107654 / DViRD3) TaxID=1121301 RepID=A0A1M6JT10_PARC5|nr:alanine--tRNA ligase [Paramaledivibacter caminithermalis]SHJ49865.1 alanyl-tRNA synthetase [Paramaledivibacter caminithermalis DSM 15212]